MKILVLATLFLFSFPALAEKQIRASLNFGTIGGNTSSGFNSETAQFSFIDQKVNNFSDGTNTRVNSHLLRIQRDEFTARVRTWNVATAGVTASDLDRQVTALLSQLGYYDRLDYVTISIGVNDVCSWTRRNYRTKVLAFQNFVNSAIARLVHHNRLIKINLIGLTNLTDAWKHGKDNYQCRSIWKKDNTCPALLGHGVTTSGRRRFSERQEGLNVALQTVSRNYPDNVRFSDNHYSSFTFIEEISTVDCFSPSIKGQWRISESSWLSGWYN